MIYWVILLSHALLIGSVQSVQFPIKSHVTKPPIIQGPVWTFFPNCWTDWFDRDDPSGTGDWETLDDLRKDYPGKICDKPLKIQVLTTGGAPAASTGDTFFYYDVVEGFACRNQDQSKSCTCQDYKVRFLCPISFCYNILYHNKFTVTKTPHTVKYPFEPITDSPKKWTYITKPTPATSPLETDCWTQWFDRDNPSGTGDWETLLHLRPEYPGKICTNPLQIDVLTITGQPIWATGDIFYKCDTVTGFICRNSDQKKGRCSDYKVRFLCPPKFCAVSITKDPFPITRNTFEPITVDLLPFTTESETWPTLFTKPPFENTKGPFPITVKNTFEPITIDFIPYTWHTVFTKPTLATKPFETNCWTQWFDRDNPTGTGDWETLLHLRKEYPGKICSKPLQIQVLTTAGQPVWSTGNIIYKSDTVTGFICRNLDQRKGRCSDYKVRFMCPPKFCAPPPTCWTEWFDRDDPSGTGDWETLHDLSFENPGRICSNPLQIQVQTTSGAPMSSTGDAIYKVDTVSGFICRNSDQKKGNCQDYKVRFRCPLDFCVHANCWTRWFDRDDPHGSGDWETLAALQSEYPGEICDTPLQIQAQTTSGLPASAVGNVFAAYDTTVGLICKNLDQRKGVRCHDFQVRFLCPPDFCRPKGCYTEWFDRDDPSGTGDWETLYALRAEYPGQICNNPLQIQVETLDGKSMAETGNIIEAADVTSGFICKNSAQPSGLCQDFRVRFYCPLEFCRQKVCWTRWFDRDNPTGTGDWELLAQLKKQYPKEICATPLYIDVRTVDTNEPITATGQNLHIYSPTQGFACRNQDQRGCTCKDYKVRFGCPCKCIVDTD